MPLMTLYRDWLKRRYSMPSCADEVHFVTTSDGVRICLKRFWARSANGERLPTTSKPHTPVLCVPGLGADSSNFDLPGPGGIGPWLAAKGREVWVIDLRGTGLSHVPDDAWPDICFDDFVDKDLVAAIPHICETAGARSLDWLGHSMGGMCLYALLAKGRGAQIRSGITIGTPVGFPEHWEVAAPLEAIKGLAPYIGGLRIKRFLRALTPVLFRTDAVPVVRNWVESKNVDVPFMRKVTYAAIDDVPRGLLLQFIDWLDNDAFRSKDRRTDYRARMAGAQLPMLVMSAPADKLGTPAAVARAVALLGRAEHVVCGEANGFSCDYGHVDIVFGKSAPDEVFPHFERFFAEQDERRPRLVARD